MATGDGPGRPDGAYTQTIRILRLLEWICRDGETNVCVASAVEALGVTTRTVRRDLAALRASGVWIEGVDLATLKLAASPRCRKSTGRPPARARERRPCPVAWVRPRDAQGRFSRSEAA